MSKPKIKPVESNAKKGKTYSELLSKYNDAKQNGYYGEAELIVYAFMEDRLRSFIYYSEGLDNWNSKTINENMQRVCGSELDVRNIGSKIEVIEKALKIAKDKSDGPKDDYREFLSRIYRATVDIDELLNRLGKIKKWCDYRNEIVHAMFNKDLDDLHKRFEAHVEEGFQLARYIDAQVSKLKKA